MIVLTILSLIVFLLIPQICQLYGVIVGGSLFFSGIRDLFSLFAPAEEVYHIDLDLSFEHLPFLIWGNAPLSKFCLGWGLLVAAQKGRSAVGYFLGASNVLGAGFGLFYFDGGSAITLPGHWGKAFAGLITVALGLTTISVILASWGQQPADSTDAE